MTTILGISAFYHDAAAMILRDGTFFASAPEEPSGFADLV